jgi:competence protein ComGC
MTTAAFALICVLVALMIISCLLLVVIESREAMARSPGASDETEEASAAQPQEAGTPTV